MKLIKNQTLWFTFAETTSYKSKNTAFTLAEVLITLGIIGVVAAMTIPTLIANTRSQQYRSQFKKSLSTLNQAAIMSQAQYDFDFGSIDEGCARAAGMDRQLNANPNTTKSICALFNGTLHGSWVNATEYPMEPKGTYQDSFMNDFSSGGAIFNLNDGATIFVITGGHCTKDNPCEGAIDVNGIKSKPNKLVQCKNPDETEFLYEAGYNDSSSGFVTPGSWQNVDSCTVDNASMGEVFPVYFYDSTVVPATNAAAYVLSTAK